MLTWVIVLGCSLKQSVQVIRKCLKDHFALALIFDKKRIGVGVSVMRLNLTEEFQKAVGLSLLNINVHITSSSPSEASHFDKSGAWACPPSVQLNLYITDIETWLQKPNNAQPQQSPPQTKPHSARRLGNTAYSGFLLHLEYVFVQGLSVCSLSPCFPELRLLWGVFFFC